MDVLLIITLYYIIYGYLFLLFRSFRCISCLKIFYYELFKKYKNLEVKKNYTYIYFYYSFRCLKNTKILERMEKKFLIDDKKVRIIRVERG